MLKAIKKFVLDRRRDADPERRQVVEEDHTGEVGSVSEARAEVAEPRDEEPAAALPVLGKVKWYDPNKRYGFIELSDGSGDAFLHATALAGIGTPTLRSGDTLELRITLRERGRSRGCSRGSTTSRSSQTSSIEPYSSTPMCWASR
jgi:cold shock protein